MFVATGAEMVGVAELRFTINPRDRCFPSTGLKNSACAPKPHTNATATHDNCLKSIFISTQLNPTHPVIHSTNHPVHPFDGERPHVLPLPRSSVRAGWGASLRARRGAERKHPPRWPRVTSAPGGQPVLPPTPARVPRHPQKKARPIRGPAAPPCPLHRAGNNAPTVTFITGGTSRHSGRRPRSAIDTRASGRRRYEQRRKAMCAPD